MVEGNSGTFSVQIPVRLSQVSANPVTVLVSTTNGTATAGADYTALVNKLVTIPAGATNATVSVTIKSDATSKPDESFNVVLSSPSGAVLGRPLGTVTILNDE